MASLEELSEQFKELGIVVSDAILKDCLDLCVKYSVDEANFVNTWFAFTLNNLGGAEISKENLIKLEKNEFINHKPVPTLKKSGFNVTPSRKKSNTSTDQYFTPTGKGQFQNIDDVSPKCRFSPSGFMSNVVQSSEKYSTRSNSGQILLSYGEPRQLFTSQDIPSFEVTPYFINEDTSNWTYMYDTLRNINYTITDASAELARLILDENNLGEPVQLNTITSDTATFVGRIIDTDGSKLNLNQIIIQGIMQNSTDQEVEVDMTQIGDFALFPGQVIAFTGTARGKKTIANKVYNSATSPKPPLQEIQNYSHTMQLMIACGPFTQSDTLTYEPLNDLIEYVNKNQPNILILIGPIIDSKHPLINNNSITDTFEEFYKKTLSRIEESLKNTRTKIVVVASSKDACNIPVYPTPPVKTKLVNVTVLPDPALISINGLAIGITSTDILMHIGKREISSGGNRLGRLASYLIQQQSFYPLYPPDVELGFDAALWARTALLPITPHILITPSDLHYFIKETNGCLIINPERITKGQTGGSFCCIEVMPLKANEQEWNPYTHLAAKIIKI